MDLKEENWADLRAERWPKKSAFSNPGLKIRFPRADVTPENEGFSIKLTNNEIIFENGRWVDGTNPMSVPTTTNPVVSENICLKRRIETLTRTAAISEIEVQQLKDEIREAKAILAQLADE